MRVHRAFWLAVAVAFAAGIVACAPVADGAADGTASQEQAETAEDQAQTEADQAQTEAGQAEEPAGTEAEEKLAQMTLEQKVAQLFMVTLETLEAPTAKSAEASIQDDPNGAQAQEAPEAVTSLTATLEQNLQTYPVGGVILFGQNIVTPEQTLALTQGLEEAATRTPEQIPLFIAVDEEGGVVARLANNESFNLPVYESAASVGASGNAKDARKMGNTIGSYLKQYGFNVDFAPDADVASDPQSSVIGSRSFSSDPVVAAQMAKAFAQGLSDEGIIATYKHFPGHGATLEDSHTTLATTQKTLEELLACELVPFGGATQEDFVMVGHIAAPQVTGNDVPATLAPELVSGVLRDQLGFEGVVVTDALGMGAITESYGPGEVAVQALKAGCDLLLMPADFEAAYNAVIAAVQTGELSEERIDESVLRILHAKYQNTLFEEADIS